MSKLSIFIIIILLGGCVNSPKRNYELTDSYLKEEVQKQVQTNVELSETKAAKVGGFNSLPPLSMRDNEQNPTQDVSSRFSEDKKIEISSDELALKDFLHYVMGELLKVNYILGDSAKKANQTVTLNIQQSISPKKLFLLTQELLTEKGFVIRVVDEVFYINNEDASQGKSAIAFGYGQASEDVPNTTSDIVQIAAFKYGVRGNVSLVLPRIASVQVTPDPQQDTVMLQGKRGEIIKALEFIRLIDTPAYRNQNVAAFNSTFVPIKELGEKLDELLKNDGYLGGLSIVYLDAQSSLVLFSADQELMARAKFWLEKLDVPADTDEKQYFVFQPNYARASDLAESLAPLLGGVQSQERKSDSAESRSSNMTTTDQQASSNARQSIRAGNDKISIVEDARSNSLIINASGKDYRALLPLIERLDVSPKQVMLEVAIVEVTLKDQFKQGVEFFLNNNNYTMGNTGAFGLSEVGGLSYILTASSRWDVNASLKQTNSLVNIISRPSIVVRDGVTANMEVGTEIPILNSTTTSDGVTSSSVQYRKTGLTLSVTPTVNSRGVVIMEIDQQVSNQLTDGVTAGGAPSIFNRNMSTEVVANSGQTVILGGLISENQTNSQNNVPGLSKIPILGHLFSVKNDEKEKTELVIMVTPRIIESGQQWDDIKAAMSHELQQIQLFKE